MSDTELNNPAGRVLALLTKAKETQARTIAEGFASVFEMDLTDNYGGLYRNLGLLNENLDSIKGRLQQTGNQRFVKRYEEALPHLRRIFAFQNSAQQWESVKQTIRAEDLTTLGFCSDALGESLPERTFSKDELAELTKKIDELWGEVLASGLEKELKLTVLECLDQIRQAIRDYKILGSKPIVSAVNNAVVCVIKIGPVTPENAPIMARVREVVGFAADLVTLGAVLYPLLHDAAKMLGN
jgi:hypothetical protein